MKVKNILSTIALILVILAILTQITYCQYGLTTLCLWVALIFKTIESVIR